MNARVRKQAADKRNLSGGGAVEMADPSTPQGPQDPRFRIAFYGVEQSAWKSGSEVTNRLGNSHWPKAMQRFVRAPFGYDPIDPPQPATV